MTHESVGDMALFLGHTLVLWFESCLFEFIVFVNSVTCDKDTFWIQDVEGSLITLLIAGYGEVLVGSALALVPLPHDDVPVGSSSQGQELALLVLMREGNGDELF